MAQLQNLIEIERSLWTNDAQVYEAAFLSDAVLIFPGIGRIDREFAVRAIRDENKTGRHWTDVRFDTPSLSTISPNVLLLTYQAWGRWSDGAEEHSHCATIYVKRDNDWRVAFHQQTPVMTS